VLTYAVVTIGAFAVVSWMGQNGREGLRLDQWAGLAQRHPGMAFGMQIGSEHGKLILTLFRLIAVSGIAYYLFYLAKKGVHKGLIWCIALILGGAIGNVVDSTFYGVLLNNAPFDAPTAWFHGQVIDMFYIDIWEGRVAEWIPIFGGDYMALWPIFNIADASIFIGVSIILIRQKSFFVENKEDESVQPTDFSDADSSQA